MSWKASARARFFTRSAGCVPMDRSCGRARWTTSPNILCTISAALVSAITGGVSIIHPPELTLLMNQFGVLSPDGRWLLAVDVQGRLARLDTAAPGAAPEWWDVPDPVQAVACDGATVLASFRAGAPLRRRAWPGA